jgi:predicted LPLAT superfamily acyltransferase
MLAKSDLMQASKVATFAAIAWSTPPRFWRKVAAAMRGFEQNDASPSLHVFQRVLGPAFDANALAMLVDRRRMCSREAKLQILGLNGPWRSWRPDIRLHGEAQLRKAFDAGRGVILWVSDSAYSTLIFKMALARAGYRASQLTRPNHGFSNSSFGIRFLNPFWCRVEDRFLEERVLIYGDNAAPALAILRARLAANRLVIITVGAVAHRFAEVPFFRHHIRVPTGPIRLAQATGAPLLPGFAFARENGGFDVTIESALPPPDKPGAFDSVAAAYAKRLEPFVKKYPEQWTGWDYLLSKETSAATD